MNRLDSWTTRAAAELGLRGDVLDRDALLDLASVVAHQVARPAAPLTTYLLGVAVGRGTSLPVAAETIRALAAAVPASGDTTPSTAKRPAHS
ncbi:DUF6457 domain-containing protein [Streptomyces solicavernae]|uniref:DUF6457 domain-containing protein n=1 Tax=Streptomyces solicavernae TaxID=3043614 RepID=UPI0032B8016D